MNHEYSNMNISYINEICLLYYCAKQHIHIYWMCKKSSISEWAHSDTVLGLNEWLNVPINNSCWSNQFQTPTASELNLTEKHVIMASIKLPCYVPTTVRYYLFSHLLVFVIHILPSNTWGNQPHQKKTEKHTTFSLWKTFCGYYRRLPLLGKIRNLKSHYLE